MAQAEYPETICIKVTKEQKAFFDRQMPNPSKWLRKLIEKEMNYGKDS